MQVLFLFPIEVLCRYSMQGVDSIEQRGITTALSYQPNPLIPTHKYLPYHLIHLNPPPSNLPILPIQIPTPSKYSMFPLLSISIFFFRVSFLPPPSPTASENRQPPPSVFAPLSHNKYPHLLPKTIPISSTRAFPILDFSAP